MRYSMEAEAHTKNLTNLSLLLTINLSKAIRQKGYTKHNGYLAQLKYRYI
jgi:hypothetical protein